MIVGEILDLVVLLAIGALAALYPMCIPFCLLAECKQRVERWIHKKKL